MKRNVLFVCIGNSCRSQMAEGFAGTYGSDVLEAESAGLAPATSVALMTREIMAERNIDLSEHFPKGLFEVDLNRYDLIVNMSGEKLPLPVRAEVRDWHIRDPIGQKREVYLDVAREIENLVMQLILQLRTKPGR